MRMIAVANMKGGVGKTTTSIVLADALSVAGRRVLALDLDPQANMSWALLSPIRFRQHGEATLTRWLTRVARNERESFSSALESVGLETANGRRADLQLAVSDTKMRFSEMAFDGPPTTEKALALYEAFGDAIERAKPSFDVCVMDCSPALSALTLAGLRHATAIVVPTPLNRLCLESLETFRQRAIVELLKLSTPLYVVPTRVGRAGGTAEQNEVRRLLRSRQEAGAWKIVDPEFRECAAYTRALDPPESGPFRNLRSKYGSQRGDLPLFYRSLVNNGALHE